MFSVEHASSTGPAVMEKGRRRGGGRGSNRLPVRKLNKLWNFHRYWLVHYYKCNFFYRIFRGHALPLMLGFILNMFCILAMHACHHCAAS